MIEYPSILHSARAPHKACIAFDKLDGSNIRIKWTRKRSFCQFGTRTQMLDESHQFFGGAITYFHDNMAEVLEPLIEKNWKNEREIVFFAEWFGPNSFAGSHDEDDITNHRMKLVLIDCLVGHKNRKFVLPQDFLKLFINVVEIPKVIYEGNLSDEFIAEVRRGDYNVVEGVVCKGRERTGTARGNVWMAKIKTESYLSRLKMKFGKGFKKYW